METAIASLRKLADEGAVGSDDPDGPLLPCTGLDYAAVGKAPAVTVSCEVVGARGPGIPGDTMPPYALWSVGGNIDAGGTTLYVGGPVSSSGSINVGTLDASGYIVQSAGGCSGTIVVLDPDDNQCGGQSAPDPGYPSRPLPDTGDLDNFNPPPICEGSGTLQFRPGLYTEASMFEDPDYGGCANGVLYFRPGVYYFDFGFADDDHVWNMGNTTIVGGEPKGWNPDGGTPGGALGALGDEEGAACQTEKDSLSAEGIQWVLGGESQIDASGATVELCAKASAPESGDQQISVYSQLTGEHRVPAVARVRTRSTPAASPAPRGPPIPRARRSGSTPRHHRRRSRRPRSSARRSPTARRRSPSPTSASARYPRGPRINSVTLRVSHRELAAATPPPNPADLASLKLQVTNGLGGACTVQDLTPNFTSDVECPVRVTPTFDITSCLNTTAKLGGASVAYAATLRDDAAAQPVSVQLDGMQIDVNYTRPTVRRLDGADPTFRIGSGGSFVNWGTFYTPIGTLAANGPVQFRRGAIAQSIDASAYPRVTRPGRSAWGTVPNASRVRVERCATPRTPVVARRSSSR